MTTKAPLSDRLGEVEQRQKAGLEMTPKTASVLDLIKGRRSLYGKVLNRTIDPERFVRVALATISNPKSGLLACNQDSLLGALMLSAQLGLEPGSPLGHAYLVKYGTECTFIVGYRGYVELARRAGYMVTADAVFEGDEFSWELGLDRSCRHVPLAEDRTDYSKLTHAYAVAESMSDRNAPKSFVVMTKAQIEVIRKRAKSQNGPWKTDPIEMAIKSPVRRLSKWMPMSIEMAQAATVDEVTPREQVVNLDDFTDPDVIDVPQLPPPAGADDAPSTPSDAKSPPTVSAEGKTAEEIADALEAELDKKPTDDNPPPPED